MEKSESTKIVDIAKVGECGYPGCKHFEQHTFDLQIDNEKDSQVQMPCCMYHYYVFAGNQFSAKKIQDTQFVIVGPLEQVALTEQIIAAIKMAEVYAKKS